MFSIIRLGLFGLVCFIAGTLTAASQAFGQHNGNDEPIAGTTCSDPKGCTKDFSTAGKGTAPTFPIKNECSAFDTSNDGYDFLTIKSQRVRPVSIKNGGIHPVNIAGRATIGFVPLVTSTGAGSKPPQHTDFSTVPYVYVTVEHCVLFPDNTKQVTTQVVRIPWNKTYAPSIETRRTEAVNVRSAQRPPR